MKITYDIPMANIAHITETGKSQPLADHLMAVSLLAGRFAEVFGASGLAKLAGLLHDMGKSTPEFQEYINGLRSSSSKTHHSAAGAWQMLELARQDRRIATIYIKSQPIKDWLFLDYFA